MSDTPPAVSARRLSALFLGLALATLALGFPVIRTYQGALRNSLGMSSTPLYIAVVAAGFALFFLLVRRFPKGLAAGTGVLALFLVLKSGNGPALIIAGMILGVTLFAGDALARLLRGFEAGKGETSILAATGAVGIGVFLLVFGETARVTGARVILVFALLVVIRLRRFPALVRLLAESSRRLWTDSFSIVEAAWVAVLFAFVFAAFLAALRPDLSWDALAYHLPQVRDLVEKGRVLPLPNLYPLTFLWRTYDTYLGLAFLAGGERVVRLVHFGMGLAAFGATAALARRLSSRERCPLALLILCAVPAACLQLRNTFVDLPAALFLAASAAEIAASSQEPRRVWLSGFLFGGAVSTKIFAVLAAPALFVLLARRQQGLWKRSLSFAVFCTIPILPWLAWNQSRLGFFLAPYYDPLKAERTNPLQPVYGPPTDPERLRSVPQPDFARLLRLPYDLTFERETFAHYGEYTGLLALPMLLGLLGWGRKRSWLIAVAALSVVIPLFAAGSLRWLLFTPRYFVCVVALYAVAAGTGLESMTENFRGGPGRAAALSAAALAIAAPIPLISAPKDLHAAITGASPEAVLRSLASYPLWEHVHPDDRVLLLGDEDRYHCPAQVVVSDTLILPEKRVDPARWRTEWGPLGINVILQRTDRRDAADFLRYLGSCVDHVATHGPATLYRVDFARLDCRWLSSGGGH